MATNSKPANARMSTEASANINTAVRRAGKPPTPPEAASFSRRAAASRAAHVDEVVTGTSSSSPASSPSPSPVARCSFLLASRKSSRSLVSTESRRASTASVAASASAAAASASRRERNVDAKTANASSPPAGCVFFFSFAILPARSRAIFIMSTRLSPSANLQHCRKSVCSKPVPAMSAYEPTSCLSLCVISMASSTARTFAAATASTSRASGRLRVRSDAHRAASTCSRNARVRAHLRSSSRYRAFSCGTSLRRRSFDPPRARVSPGTQQSLASVAERVRRNRRSRNSCAPCATATRPVNSRWPTRSMLVKRRSFVFVLGFRVTRVSAVFVVVVSVVSSRST
mmetsp:Transcript_11543/g.49209  ORF Transcript_11543/g.49209 Transcript_11543/m.49209 type:complete len:344 (+) Transcript_11543:376-1407(+)